MDFKDYVEGEMEYYEEYYAELNILLKEYGYDCDVMDIEYTTADWYPGQPLRSSWQGGTLGQANRQTLCL